MSFFVVLDNLIHWQHSIESQISASCLDVHYLCSFVFCLFYSDAFRELLTRIQFLQDMVLLDGKTYIHKVNQLIAIKKCNRHTFSYSSFEKYLSHRMKYFFCVSPCNLYISLNYMQNQNLTKFECLTAWSETAQQDAVGCTVYFSPGLVLVVMVIVVVLVMVIQ